jgi:hypothetical protein
MVEITDVKCSRFDVVRIENEGAVEVYNKNNGEMLDRIDMPIVDIQITGEKERVHIRLSRTEAQQFVSNVRIMVSDA